MKTALEKEVETSNVPCRGNVGASVLCTPQSYIQTKNVLGCKGVRFSGTAMDNQDAEWYNDLSSNAKPSVQACSPTCMESKTPKELAVNHKRKLPIMGKFGRLRHKFQRMLS